MTKDAASWRAEALAIERESFRSNHARAEAFERVRERLDDEDAEGLFDLAVLEADAHTDARGGRALSGDEADVLLSAWERVIGGAVVPGREDGFHAALASVAQLLLDRTLDGSPEVAARLWLSLARGALRAEEPALLRRALECWSHACAATFGGLRGHCALAALELAGHLEASEPAHIAAEWLWALREHPEVDDEDRAMFLGPVWQVRMALGDVAGAREAADALLGDARRAGRPEREADALLAVAECAMADDHPRDALEALERRLEIAERMLASRPEDVFAMARRDEAIEALDAVRRAAAERGRGGVGSNNQERKNKRA